MKIKLLIPLIILFAFISQEAFSQLGNSNMYLLKNLNPRPGVGGGNPYAAIWGYKAPNGREYALLACFSGTSFVDITDSATIHEVDFQSGPSSNWREMKVYDHYAYIVTDVTGGVGVQIVDLQYLPDSVRFVKNWTTAGILDIHTISQEGPYLYLNGGDATPNGGITVLNITDPINPVKLGSWNNKYVHDCRVKNDTIYACNIYTSDGGTVSVINASNKSSLVNINSWANNPNPGPHNCALSTDSRYCFVADEINGNPRLMKIWNISNLSNVTQVATWQPTNIATSVIHNIETYGNYALVGHYTAGVRVVNISNPSAPTEVAWYDTYPSNNDFTYNGCWGVYMFPSGKIAASDRQTGLYVLKTTMALTNASGVGTATPESYKLEQNYPNPFNPATTINFSLPKNSHVSLEIFDMSGKKAAVLVNDKRDAGLYEIKVDASKYGLTSGVYFYKMTANSIEGVFSETKKMILVK